MSWQRPSLLVAGWLVAAVLAVVVGVVTVAVVGDSMRDRGPIGTGMIRDPSPTTPSSIPPDQLTTQVFSEEFGDFEVGCQGVYAVTVEVRPAAGWTLVGHDAGPDDDVDATFADGSREAEISVFCNRGTPTLDEVEYDTLGD